MEAKGCQVKPKIDYPCPWLFKVIGFGSAEVEDAIRETIGGDPCKITASKKSSGGKYHSVNLEMEVVSEEHRNGVYRELCEHVSIKYVL
jgi:hypothetical protein